MTAAKRKAGKATPYKSITHFVTPILALVAKADELANQAPQDAVAHLLLARAEITQVLNILALDAAERAEATRPGFRA